MIKYTKLQIPSNSAWDRKTWRSNTPNWLLSFIDSTQNLINWLPVIWKDRHWDDYYINRILQRKIELQREYLIKANRHTCINEDNFWMTVVLNLIELENEEYYTGEKYSYEQSTFEFVENKSRPGSFEMVKKVEWEKLDDYLHKYPNIIRKVMKKYPDVDFSNKDTLSFYVGRYNQQRCRNLLFEILKRYSDRWWD